MIELKCAESLRREHGVDVYWLVTADLHLLEK